MLILLEALGKVMRNLFSIETLDAGQEQDRSFLRSPASRLFNEGSHYKEQPILSPTKDRPQTYFDRSSMSKIPMPNISITEAAHDKQTLPINDYFQGLAKELVTPAISYPQGCAEGRNMPKTLTPKASVEVPRHDECVLFANNHPRENQEGNDTLKMLTIVKVSTEAANRDNQAVTSADRPRGDSKDGEMSNIAKAKGSMEGMYHNERPDKKRNKSNVSPLTIPGQQTMRTIDENISLRMEPRSPTAKQPNELLITTESNRPREHAGDSKMLQTSTHQTSTDEPRSTSNRPREYMKDKKISTKPETPETKVYREEKHNEKKLDQGRKYLGVQQVIIPEPPIQEMNSNFLPDDGPKHARKQPGSLELPTRKQSNEVPVHKKQIVSTNSPPGERANKFKPNVFTEEPRHSELVDPNSNQSQEHVRSKVSVPKSSTKETRRDEQSDQTGKQISSPFISHSKQQILKTAGELVSPNLRDSGGMNDATRHTRNPVKMTSGLLTEEPLSDEQIAPTKINPPEHVEDTKLGRPSPNAPIREPYHDERVKSTSSSPQAHTNEQKVSSKGGCLEENGLPPKDSDQGDIMAIYSEIPGHLDESDSIVNVTSDDAHIPLSEGKQKISQFASIKNLVQFARGSSKTPTPEERIMKLLCNASATTVQVMHTEDLLENDIIIAVMGPTGSGKSSFINMATNMNYPNGVGHSLISCTSEISVIKYESIAYEGANIIFVDTPGFDDTYRSDFDTLKLVSEWLKATYNRKILLSGILYLHRISDNAMASTSQKMFRMFEELCGKNAFQNIILVTTMWDDVDAQEGIAREAELKQIYWKSMLDRNSKVSRYNNTYESAWDVLGPLVKRADPKAILLQKELVDEKMQLWETHAGQVVYSQLEEISKLEKLLYEEHDILKQMRAERMGSNNAAVLEGLKKRCDEVQAQIELKQAEIQTMKLSMKQRLRYAFHVLNSKRFHIRGK